MPLDLRSNRDAIRAGIGYLSEDRLSLGLIQPQSIADNMVLPVLDKILDAADLMRKKAALVATGSTILRSGSAGRPMRSRRFRAATSSASPSPNGWRPVRS